MNIRIIPREEALPDKPTMLPDGTVIRNRYCAFEGCQQVTEQRVNPVTGVGICRNCLETTYPETS